MTATTEKSGPRTRLNNVCYSTKLYAGITSIPSTWNHLSKYRWRVWKSLAITSTNPEYTLLSICYFTRSGGHLLRIWFLCGLRRIWYVIVFMSLHKRHIDNIHWVPDFDVEHSPDDVL